MDEMNIVNWAAESGKHHEAKDDEEGAPEIPKYCRNCGYEVPKLYCTYCGQSAKNVRVSFHSLIMDFMGDYFTFDSKLFRSVVPLFFKPGFLTAAFMEGKRVRFIPPLRLYIFSSIIFFLSLSAVTNPKSWFEDKSGKKQDENPGVTAPVKAGSDAKDKDKPPDLKTGAEESGNTTSKDARVGKIPAGKPESTGSDGKDQEKTENPEISEPDNAEPQKPKPKKKSEKKSNINLMSSGFDEETWWGRWINKRVRAQEEKLEAMDQKDLASAFVNTSIRNVPKALFLLMPLFAFFLKLLYVRRDPLYIDHLIFAFHFHAFLFLLYSALIGIGFAIAALPNWFFVMAIFLIPPVYLFLDLKKVYRQGWIKTFIKFNLLSFMYFFSLNIIVVLVSIISIFMI